PMPGSPTPELNSATAGIPMLPAWSIARIATNVFAPGGSLKLCAVPAAAGAGAPVSGVAEAKFCGVIGLEEVTTSYEAAVPHISSPPGAVHDSVDSATPALIGLPGASASCV